MNQIVHNQIKSSFKSVSLGLVNIDNEKIIELEKRILKLENICQDLNPYQEISNELKIRLSEFHILELSDPFKITNTLLMLLEDSIDEFHILRPLDDLQLNHEIL
jgi:hypothetical protein